MPLLYVKHSQIDLSRWDYAMASCYNENPYGYSSWLNLVSPNWDALLDVNYEILIPLPVKRKFGITYLSQPRFTQQLGIFSLHPVSSDFKRDALLKIGDLFPKIHLQLNVSNYDATLPLSQQITCVLPLNESYEMLFTHFDSHHKRNINKALEIKTKENLRIEPSDDFELFIAHFKKTVGIKDTSISKNDYTLMSKIISSHGKILFCLNAQNEILAGLFYLKSKTKIINLFNFITPEGKNKKTMYLLLQTWIRSYANTPLVLDFEGSEIKSIARFYTGFGASPQNYQIFTKKAFWQL